MNYPNKINKLINSGSITKLLARARVLATLNQQLPQLLDAPLVDHCQVLAIQDGALVISADSPVWASRLRFHIPMLVKHFSRIRTVPVRTIKVRVLPPATIAVTPPKAPRKACGAAGKQALIQAARNVSDPELKSALEKLASHYPGR